MKRVIAIILCFALLIGGSVVLVSCRKNNNTNNQSTDVIDGGWSRASSPVITKEIKTVFDKATASLDGVEYIPVAYIASQVVAGTNHCVLCKATPTVPDAKTTYALVYIYEDLEGKAEITEVLNSEFEIDDGQLSGGWSETETPILTDDAKNAIAKANEVLAGAQYTPVALLATQVFAGTNSLVFCECQATVPDAEKTYTLVSVYTDLDGNSTINDVYEFTK